MSPLTRVAQTARPLSQRLGIQPRVLPWLAELGHPAFAGEGMDKVDEFFWQATLRPPEAWWGGLPGGEPFRAFTERVQAGMVQLLADFWAVSYDGDGHRLGELLSNVVDGG